MNKLNKKELNKIWFRQQQHT